jgi:hypothetical protein
MSPIELSKSDAQTPLLHGVAKLEQFFDACFIRIYMKVVRVHVLPWIPSRKQSTHFLHVTLDSGCKGLFGDVVRHKQDHVEQIASTENIVDYTVSLRAPTKNQRQHATYQHGHQDQASSSLGDHPKTPPTQDPSASRPSSTADDKPDHQS